MRKKNGFVFIETIVVVSVLSLTLLLLFSSYSYILRKARERDTFETTETIYKTYYTKSIIDSLRSKTDPTPGVLQYIKTKLNNECFEMFRYDDNSGYAYKCDKLALNGPLGQVVQGFEVEKFYLVNLYKLFQANKKNDYLFMFDATTIDYINELGGSRNVDLLIVKYKKKYNKNDDTYEILHSSAEVQS